MQSPVSRMMTCCRFVRPTLERLEDRTALAAAAADSLSAAQVLPDIQMNTATTTDARTITVSYTIAGAPITNQPLNFSVYRSANPNSLAGAQLLGSASLPASDAADLAAGQHQGVVLALRDPQGNPIAALTPNPALPFVVVVANPAGTIAESDQANDTNNTAWFETFVLGVVSHGLEFDPFGNLPKWETQMAATLQQDGYQAVIAFNWTRTSFIPLPGFAVQAGNRLAREITTLADQLAAQHPGDVVDIQFIGHSRGAVVVSQAAQDLNGTSDPALRGAYMLMTLLDPHPASNASGLLLSFEPFVPLSLDIAVGTYVFQLLANDPQVLIPSDVQQAEVFFQHTRVPNKFQTASERLVNLWGETPTTLFNQSGQSIDSLDLTGAMAPGGGLVGHSEVHDWYEANVAAKDQTFTFFG
jgi:hypothetical protein